jgi:hypothetical protein
MTDVRFDYRCIKCREKISERSHEWCRLRGMVDLCFSCQPEFVKKSLDRWKEVKHDPKNNKLRSI